MHTPLGGSFQVDVAGAGTRAIVVVEESNDEGVVAGDRHRPAELVPCGGVARGELDGLVPGVTATPEHVRGAGVCATVVVPIGADEGVVPADRRRPAARKSTCSGRRVFNRPSTADGDHRSRSLYRCGDTRRDLSVRRDQEGVLYRGDRIHSQKRGAQVKLPVMEQTRT